VAQIIFADLYLKHLQPYLIMILYNIIDYDTTIIDVYKRKRIEKKGTNVNRCFQKAPFWCDQLMEAEQ
jgi:hypothetical protein